MFSESKLRKRERDRERVGRLGRKRAIKRRKGEIYDRAQY